MADFLKFFIGVASLLTVGVCPAMADIYKMQSGEGNVYFTDRPPGTGTLQKILKQYKIGRGGGRASSSHWPISFSNKYDRLIRSASDKYNIDFDLIKSVIKVESDFNRRTVSSKGAKGLMQLMPMTARDMNVANVFDARQNIFGGTKYLKKMLREFGGSQHLALAAYNAGPTAVRKYNGIPPYRETIQYVKKVLLAKGALARAYPAKRGFTASGASFTRRQKVNHYYIRSNGSGARIYSDAPIGKKKILRY